VWVAYASSNGSALAGSDYQPVSASVSLAAGLTSVTIAVPIYEWTLTGSFAVGALF
jgi:hypothetical protein